MSSADGPAPYTALDLARHAAERAAALEAAARLTPTEPVDMRRAALDLTELGAVVFPVRARAKAPPLVVAWPAIDTADAAQVDAWWTEHANANIALQCGVRSGVVIDVDGAQGAESLAELERVHGPLPMSVAARTGRGLHLYYAHPGYPVANSCGSLAPHIDVRGDGGYVLCPPSIHPSGERYTWLPGRALGEIDLAPLPEWLAEWMRARTDRGASMRQHATDRDAPPSAAYAHNASDRNAQPSAAPGRTKRWAARALQLACASVAAAAEGGRNTALNNNALAVGELVAGDALDIDVARDALLRAAVSCGLSEHEALATIASGFRAGERRNARSEPPERKPIIVQPSAATRDRADLPPPKYRLLCESIEPDLKPIGERLATGIKTLDRALRGGLPMKRRFTVQGPPGSGKTGLLVELIDRWARLGVPIVWLAADELPAAVITRLGQRAGLLREDLECGGECGDIARATFAAQTVGLPIVVLDPDADESASTIEDAARVLEDLSFVRPGVLVVDSLQTVRCRAAEGVESIRERTDAKLAVLKGVAQRGSLVMMTSEVARGAYRSRDRTQNIDPLAAGKESGSIEYSTDVLIALSSVRGEAGLVDVVIAKNRLGQKLPFRLRVDSVRASFEEVAMPADDEESALSDARTDAQCHAAAQRVRDAILTHPNLKSQRDVLAVCKGAQNRNAAAFRTLTLDGEVTKVGGFYRLSPQIEEARHAAE